MSTVFISILYKGMDEARSVFYVLENNKLKTYDSLTAFQHFSDLVSFDWDNTVSWLRDHKKEMAKHLIDIEQLGKQLHGRKLMVEEHLPWSIWQIVKPYYKEEKEGDFVKTQKVFHEFIGTERAEAERLFIRLLLAMQEAYENLIEKAKEIGEYNRFWNVERIIRFINLERTYKGIEINTCEISNWVIDLSNDVYKLRNQLQLKYGIISVHDRETVISGIQKQLTISDAVNVIREKGYYFFLKDKRLLNPVIDLLYKEKKSANDLQVLLAIGALRPKHKKIYPIYDSFGTITGRTKLITPNLQQLTKKYRSIVEAETGKELLYADYAQFEAGILADESKDLKLIKVYNESDIYNEIGVKIGIERYISDSKQQRKFCKSIFYRYSYGMDIKNHSSILEEFGVADHRDKLSPLIISAFSEYTTLENYRTKIQTDLIENGRVGTRDGNYRYKSETEQSTSWALSQRIQGTASLILKKAIITLRVNHPEIELLIPMHDAALFQVPADLKFEKQAIINSIFEQAFLSECPSIKARVNFKDFTE